MISVPVTILEWKVKKKDKRDEEEKEKAEAGQYMKDARLASNKVEPGPLMAVSELPSAIEDQFDSV